MTNIKELNLSPAIYHLLAINGIKTVEGLSRFTEKEIETIIPDSFRDLKISKEVVLGEIKTSLNWIGKSLNSTDEEEVLDTEKRIQELNLSNITVERLRRNKIVTLGKLLILDESDFARMYRVGKRTQDDIKKVLDQEASKIEKYIKKK